MQQKESPMADTKVIVWKLHLRSSPEYVFQFLTTDEGREKFWAEKSRQDGERIEMEFTNGLIGTSTIINVVPPHVFEFEYFNSHVKVELKNDGSGGTDLLLINSGVLEGEYMDVLPGWLNVLLPLKAAVDFGIDLRNHDRERTWDQKYVDQ